LNSCYVTCMRLVEVKQSKCYDLVKKPPPLRRRHMKLLMVRVQHRSIYLATRRCMHSVVLLRTHLTLQQSSLHNHGRWTTRPQRAGERPSSFPLHIPHSRQLPHRHRHFAHRNNPPSEPHPLPVHRHRHRRKGQTTMGPPSGQEETAGLGQRRLCDRSM